jgi:hypothetical protein
MRSTLARKAHPGRILLVFAAMIAVAIVACARFDLLVRAPAGSIVDASVDASMGVTTNVKVEYVAVNGEPLQQPKHFGAVATFVDPFSYLTGTCSACDGGICNVAIATGFYVTGLAMHATADGGALTITPSGPQVTDAQPGGAIPIPAGGFSLARPSINGSQSELGNASNFQFSGCDSYFLALQKGVGP